MNSEKRFVVCVSNEGCEDLERRMLHAVVADDDAAADGYLRIIDESGDDYLYPARNFGAVELPLDVVQALETG